MPHLLHSTTKVVLGTRRKLQTSSTAFYYQGCARHEAQAPNLIYYVEPSRTARSKKVQSGKRFDTNDRCHVTESVATAIPRDRWDAGSNLDTKQFLVAANGSLPSHAARASHATRTGRPARRLAASTSCVTMHCQRCSRMSLSMRVRLCMYTYL